MNRVALSGWSPCDGPGEVAGEHGVVAVLVLLDDEAGPLEHRLEQPGEEWSARRGRALRIPLVSRCPRSPRPRRRRWCTRPRAQPRCRRARRRGRRPTVAAALRCAASGGCGARRWPSRPRAGGAGRSGVDDVGRRAGVLVGQEPCVGDLDVRGPAGGDLLGEDLEHDRGDVHGHDPCAVRRSRQRQLAGAGAGAGADVDVDEDRVRPRPYRRSSSTCPAASASSLAS